MRGTWLVGVALLCGCASGSLEEPQAKYMVLTAFQEVAMQTVVTEELDARDRSFFGTKAGVYTNGSIIVCGWVRGTTRKAGFTGSVPYVGYFRNRDGAFVLSLLGRSRDESEAIIDKCRAIGLRISTR